MIDQSGIYYFVII